MSSLGLTIRPMTPADVPAGQRLREQAGWNQSEHDWRRLLAWEPDGCFVGELGGAVVATATVTTYRPALAWIGMVLVDADHRRRGVGRALFEHAMAALESRGIRTIGLDATPLGKELYDRLGYVDVCRLERCVGSVPDPAPIAGGVRLLRSEDLPAVAAFDARAFGADRRRVLESLARDHPEGCFVAERAGALAGYLLSRPGARARHLGPLVARDSATAEALARAALRPWSGGQAVIDVLLPNPHATALADCLGLQPIRAFIRMIRGAPPPPADYDILYTSAGPEIG